MKAADLYQYTTLKIHLFGTSKLFAGSFYWVKYMRIHRVVLVTARNITVYNNEKLTLYSVAHGRVHSEVRRKVHSAVHFTVSGVMWTCRVLGGDRCTLAARRK